MQSILTLGLILFSVYSTHSYARVDKSPFKVSFKGKNEFLKGHQKRVELQMARSTSYCRGFYMPKAAGAWSCKKTGPGVSTCQMTYRCRVMTKTFNRNSEGTRIKKELKKVRLSKDPLRIKVGRKPYKKLRTKKLVKQLSKVKAAPRPRPKPEPKIDAPEAPKVSNDQLDEFAELKKGDDVADAMVKSEGDVELPQEEDDLEEDLEELKENVEKKTVVDRKTGEELEVIEDEKKSDSPYESGPAHFAAFSLELIQVADDFDSIVTLGASWTPRKDFNSKIGMRGQFGLKSLKIFSGTALEETFLVYELGLYMYLHFNQNFYAEAGYFLQKWNDTAGSSESGLSFGFGYKFSQKVMKVFDRVFIDYSTLSNESSNRELKFAAGISF